ncbi:MAG: hypothetical protein ABSG76_08610 [Xanthobacteraceae bacterium]|jgi:uncharacterized membrane protein YkoI
MAPVRFVIALALAGWAALPRPVAADEHRCLDPEERRAAIAGRQAVPLTKAVHAVRAHVSGEVVHARLCEQGKTLVYVLTVLGHDGKVSRASIDGASGAFLRAR